MGWLGLPIDLMNSIFVIFVIGVGEDYAVFLVTSKLEVWRGESSQAAVNSASVLVSALTTIFGFGVMVIAESSGAVLDGCDGVDRDGLRVSGHADHRADQHGLALVQRPAAWGARAGGIRWGRSGCCCTRRQSGFLYYMLRPILKIVSPATATDKLRRATRWMARGVVKWMPFGKLEFQNISAETFAKPCLVISNHQSAVDVMLMVSLPGDVRQTAKKRVFDEPMLGVGCKILGSRHGRTQRS